MEDKISVSVVMPTYNAERYISSTIKSVLSQTFSDFEMIIVDDCSTDRTVEIANSFCDKDSRVKLIKMRENSGAPAKPRNEGVKRAKGEWVAFVDADDIWHPEKLACQMQAILHFRKDFCSTKMQDFEQEIDLEFEKPVEAKIEKISFMRQIIKSRIPTSSVVARRSLLLKYPFNEEANFKAREDLDCWLHCHEEIGDSIRLAHPFVGYRTIPGQISGKKWLMMRRHLYVLRQYRFKSGKGLGVGAYIFTASHFILAIYYRLLKKGL